MNTAVRLVTILSAVPWISVGLSRTHSIEVKPTSGQPSPDNVGLSEATPLADDNKMVCCWRCQDDGTMKGRATSVSFCNKMGR